MKKILSLLVVCFLFLTSLAHADDVPAPTSGKNFKTIDGEISFLMDAPIEKIKGSGKIIGGDVTFDGTDFKTVKGTVQVDLTTFKTATFDDAGKNSAQTEHMLNWMEVGAGGAKRDQFKTATLKFQGANHVAAAPKGGSILQLDGELSLHGISKKVAIELHVNPKDGGFVAQTTKPFMIGLADYDIRPRDLAGQLLQKGLEALGQKVAKDAQVSVNLTLKP